MLLCIELFLIFLLHRRYAKEVCDAIVAKCLTGRPKTVEKAQMSFLLWVELEAVEAFLVLITSMHCPSRMTLFFLLCASLTMASIYLVLRGSVG